VTLILKPQGRGNWRVTSLQIDSKHCAPFFFQVGQTMRLGMVSFRICEVIA
jgi:hypothetical protein